MKAYIKEPGKKPELKEIDNELEALQKIVGGYIETITISDHVIICNEEGRLMNLPRNCVVVSTLGRIGPFVGTIIVCGINGEEFADATKSFESAGKQEERAYLL